MFCGKNYKMANIDRLQWLFSKLEISTEEELETLLLEALTPDMAKKLSDKLNTLAWQRSSVLKLTQAEMAQKIGQLYEERKIRYSPPNLKAISRLERGEFFPNLKPKEIKIWAEAYEVSDDEFSRMIEDLAFPEKSIA